MEYHGKHSLHGGPFQPQVQVSVLALLGFKDRPSDGEHTCCSYPYVFLNDVPFDDNFKQKTQGIISSTAEYGLIPKNHWSEHPSWIDEEKAKKAREEMAKNNVIYGDSVPYREMCRYQSGFFFRHPLLDK